jgi:hypothetical protein
MEIAVTPMPETYQNKMVRLSLSLSLSLSHTHLNRSFTQFSVI